MAKLQVSLGLYEPRDNLCTFAMTAWGREPGGVYGVVQITCRGVHSIRVKFPVWHSTPRILEGLSLAADYLAQRTDKWTFYHCAALLISFRRGKAHTVVEMIYYPEYPLVSGKKQRGTQVTIFAIAGGDKFARKLHDWMCALHSASETG